MILGVEVALDDDVEVRDLCLTPRVEAEAAVEGVDVLVGEFGGLPQPPPEEGACRHRGLCKFPSLGGVRGGPVPRQYTYPPPLKSLYTPAAYAGRS